MFRCQWYSENLTHNKRYCFLLSAINFGCYRSLRSLGVFIIPFLISYNPFFDSWVFRDGSVLSPFYLIVGAQLVSFFLVALVKLISHLSSYIAHKLILVFECVFEYKPKKLSRMDCKRSEKGL